MAEIIIDQGAKIFCDDRKYRLCGHTDVVLLGKDEQDREQRVRQDVQRDHRDGAGADTPIRSVAELRAVLPTYLSVTKTAKKLGVVEADETFFRSSYRGSWDCSLGGGPHAALWA